MIGGSSKCVVDVCSVASWRLELFFKSKAELQAKVIPYLKDNSIKRINVTNKAKEDKLQETCQALVFGLPGTDVCLHYSFKWNYRQSAEESFKDFSNFCSSLAGHDRVSVLLVSGGGKKRKLDTLEALRRLQTENKCIRVPHLHVAFNPYFPSAADAAEERKRLAAKLSTGLVQGVYLQMGTDLQRLQEGLQFLNGVTCESGKEVTVHGSIFLPSKRLLAQMKYRPWNGVFLSDAYLSGVEEAAQITQEILKLYAQHSVIPLVESKVSSTQELRQCLDMLMNSKS